MFDHIAQTYDTLNHRLSWNIDRRWRKSAIKALVPYHPTNILDVATGTGDFAILAAQMLQPSSIIGADISEQMMKIGKTKAEENGLQDIIQFEKEDCLALSYDSCTFDAAISAFGIRNFPDLEQGLKEIHRVIKEGGHACIIELTCPISFPMRQLFWLYSHTILPIYGKLISKDKSAYKYLIATIEAFPQGEEMVEILKKTGFSDATFKRMTFGICTAYFATK